MTIAALARKSHRQAVKRYNTAFQANLYHAAIADKSTEHNNQLLHDAFALCGSPYRKVSSRRYSKQALTFLEAFTA